MVSELWLYEIEQMASLGRASAVANDAATQIAELPAPVPSTGDALPPLHVPLPLALLGLVIARRQALVGSRARPAASLPFLDTRLGLLRRLKAGLRWLRSSLHGVF